MKKDCKSSFFFAKISVQYIIFLTCFAIVIFVYFYLGNKSFYYILPIKMFQSFSIQSIWTPKLNSWQIELLKLNKVRSDYLSLSVNDEIQRSNSDYLTFYFNKDFTFCNKIDMGGYIIFTTSYLLYYNIIQIIYLCLTLVIPWTMYVFG